MNNTDTVEDHYMNENMIGWFSCGGKYTFKFNNKSKGDEVARDNNASAKRVKLTVSMVETEAATLVSVVSCARKVQSILTSQINKGDIRRRLAVQIIAPCVYNIQPYDAQVTLEDGSVVTVPKYKVDEPAIIFKPDHMSVADFEKQIGCKSTTTFWLWEQVMSELRRLWTKEKNAFVGQWDEIQARAKKELDDLYEDSYFISKADLEEGYRFEFDKEMMERADAEKLKKMLGSGFVNKLLADKDAEYEAKLASGDSAVLENVLNPVLKVLERVEDFEDGKKGSIGSAVLKDVLHGVQLVKLKASDRPDIRRICGDVEMWATRLSDKTLRRDGTSRDIAKAEAKELIDNISEAKLSAEEKAKGVADFEAKFGGLV